MTSCPNCGQSKFYNQIVNELKRLRYFCPCGYVFVIPPERPTREQLHMETALRWAERSTCKQPDRKIGAVITPPSMDEILAFGYNGPSRSRPNYSCSYSADQPHSRCSCIHSEQNALLKCGAHQARGAYLFLTMQPCFMCAQLIDQARIAKVYYLRKYRSYEGLELLKQAYVETVHFTDVLKDGTSLLT